MARSREVSEAWLWRAVSWPLARLSTLFGLAGEARSERAAGRHQMETCLNISSASSSSWRSFLLSLKPLSQVWSLCWPKLSDKVSYAAVFCHTSNMHILYFTLFLLVSFPLILLSYWQQKASKRHCHQIVHIDYLTFLQTFAASVCARLMGATGKSVSRPLFIMAAEDF